jgi:hypothetical protein
MSIFIKHYYVSAENPNIVLYDVNSIKGGKTHPNIQGLHVEIQTQDENSIDYCLSVVPNESDTNLAGVEVLNEEQWKNEWEIIFNRIKQKVIKDIYIEYKSKFANLPDEYYHPYEMLYSNYIKRVEAASINSQMSYEEAKILAPTIAIEADERGINIFILAQKILTHASQFDIDQATLLAERGIKVDVIDSIVCDNTSVETIKASISQLFTENNEPDIL